MAETTQALDLIAVERKRQVDEEGWTPEHDDLHSNGELAKAAAAYALPDVPGLDRRGGLYPISWSWKPGDRIRDLVKAGALIVAEIERLQRASKASDA